MNAKEELQRLKEANLPRMEWRDVLILKEGESLPESDEKALSEYFRHFVKMEDGKCVCCGAKQGAKDIMEAFVGAHFTWGIVHGEGFCSRCKWPARAYHFNVGPIERFEMIMQFHPDELSVR